MLANEISSVYWGSNSVNGFLSSRDNLKEVIEKSFKFEEYDELSKNAIKTAKMYENSFVIEKQIEIYKKILGNKI